MIVNPSMLMPAISEQISVIFFALLLGVFLGALYDLFRVTRVFIGVRYSKTLIKLWDKKLPLIGVHRFGRGKNITDKIKGAVISVEDILFFVLSGCIVSVFIYRYCYGILRWYVFFGAILGFAAYYVTVGRVVLTVAEFIMFLVVTFAKYVFFFTARPIILAFSKTKNTIKKLKDKKAENKSEEK